MNKLLVPVGVVLLSVTTLHAHDDMNCWGTIKISGTINDWAGIAVQQELWYDTDELVKENQLMQFTFKVSDWLTVAPGFRFEEEKKKGRFQHENRPTLDLVFKQGVFGWKLEDRLRFELRDKEGSDHAYMRYRNRIKVKSPWTLTDYKINPYGSWEMFVEDKPGVSGNDLFNRNRFQLGVSAKLTKKLSVGVFYMLQISKGSDGWDPLHVPGLEFSYAF